MSTLSENLKNLMGSHDLTSAELSRRTGIGQTVINRLMNGVTVNPNIETLAPIASYFSINIDDLVTHENNYFKKKDTRNAYISKNNRKIPIISWAEAIRQDVAKKHPRKTLKIIETAKGLADLAFALIIEKELDNRFPKGTLLIVDPTRAAKHKDYVIVQMSQYPLATLKRYILDGNDVFLKSIDPTLAPIKYKQKEQKIIGIVVQSIFDFY